jgi:hypothetical protein
MRTLTLLALVACLGMPMSYAQATADADAESRLMALERIAKLQAYETKDLKTLDAILDESFVQVDPEGRLLAKAEVLAYVQAADSLQYIVEAMIVKLHGNTAVVTGLYRMKGVERGKAFARKGRFVDTWLFKNRRWVAIAGLTTPSGS